MRFGFMPPSESIALGHEGKKQDKEDIIIHVFHTGVNECEKCQKLDGTRISPEDWADEERMKKKGFWKQKNGEYLPHPHCKCHWEEETEEKNNLPADESYTGDVITARVKNAPGPLFGADYTFNGFDDLICQLEKKNQPHSIGKLVLINHGKEGEVPIGNKEYLENFKNHPILRAKIRHLKKLLSPHAIVEIRMCEVGSGDIGKKTGQSLADMLGCRVKLYEEQINAQGRRPWIKKDPLEFQNGFNKPKCQIYYPRD